MIIKEYNKYVDRNIDKKFLLKYVKNVDNFKPSVYFDEKYSTTLSQEYTFPFGLTANEVWNIIEYDITYYKKHKEESEKYSILLENLTNEHFPYVDFDKISRSQKAQILDGMASCFNSDDIIWFSIDEMYHYKNIEVNKEVEKLPNNIQNDIRWVMSLKTLKTMKTQLKEKGII